MKRRKPLLSEEELLVRKERDKVRKTSKRASETCEQTLHRQEQKQQTHMANMRASETFEHIIRARTEPNTYGKHESF